MKNELSTAKRWLIFALISLVIVTQVPMSFADDSPIPDASVVQDGDSGVGSDGGFGSEDVLGEGENASEPSEGNENQKDSSVFGEGITSPDESLATPEAIEEIETLGQNKLFMLGDGLSTLSAPLTFDINAPLGGGTIESGDTGKIVTIGSGWYRAYSASTANLNTALTELASAPAGDYLLYLGAGVDADANGRSNLFKNLTNVGTLVITGKNETAGDVPATPTPATSEGSNKILGNTGGSDINFGSNVLFRNIRYTYSNIYMNGHSLTLGNQSWATRDTNYYGGASGGDISGNPSMTVWSTGTGKGTFVGGSYRGTLNGNASVTINNTSGNRIEVWGAGYGTGTSNTANLNGSATTTINGLAPNNGGLGYFAGGVQYGNVTGTITNTISGPGRFNYEGVPWSYDWYPDSYSLLLGGSRKGDIGQASYRPSTDSSGKPVSGTGTNVITNNIDTSAWTFGRAHYMGANFAGGTVQGNIVNTVKTGKKENVGSIISFSGAAGRNAYVGVNGESETRRVWLDKWDVKVNGSGASSTGLTVGNVDAAVQAAKDEMRFELYGNITNEIKTGVIYGSGWDWDRHMRGAGYGFVEGNVISHVGTEGPAGRENAFNRPAYSTTDPTIGEDSDCEFSGGGGWPDQPQSSMIIGDTELYLDNVWGDWVYGGSYSGCQIGDTLAVLNNGIVDTLEGAGHDYYVHIGDSRAEVRGGQVDWFLSGVGYDDRYSVGNTSVEIYEAPKVGNQVMPVINASVGGMYGLGTDRNYVSGDSTLVIHGGDFSGIARWDPYQGLSAGPSNYGYIFGNATTTIDVRGNTQGFKVESRRSDIPNRVSGGLRYGAGNNTYLGASSANTITLNVFADTTTGSLLKGMNLYGDGAASTYASNTRAGKITININAPGADIGELYATNYSNISGSQLRRDVTINLVSAKSVEGITSCGPSDDLTKSIVSNSLAANPSKQAVINVGPQPKPADWDDRPVASGGQGPWPLTEFETVPAADGFPPRINVTKNGVTNFTSMTIKDRLLIAAGSGSIRNSSAAKADNHGASYNTFGDVTIKDGAGLGISGTGAFIAGKLNIEGLGYVTSPGGNNQVVISDIDFIGANSRLEWLKIGSTAASNLEQSSTWFGVASGYPVITVNSTVGGDATVGKLNAVKFTPVNLTGRDMLTGKTYIGDSSIPSANNKYNGWGVCIPGSFYTWNVIPGPDGVSNGTIKYHMNGSFNIDSTKTGSAYLDVYSTSPMDTPSKSGSMAIPSAKMPNPVDYPQFTFTPDVPSGEWVKSLLVQRSDHYVSNPVGAGDYKEGEQSVTDYTVNPANRVREWNAKSADKDYSFDITVDYTSMPELTASSVILKESDAKALVYNGATQKSDNEIVAGIISVTSAKGRPFFTNNLDAGKIAEAVTKLGDPLAPGEKSRTFSGILYETHETSGGAVSLSKQVSIVVVPDEAAISPDGKAALTAADAYMSIPAAHAIKAQNGESINEANIDWWTGASVIVVTEDATGMPIVEQKNADLYAASTMVDTFKAVTGTTEIDLDYSYIYTYKDSTGADQSFKLERNVKSQIHAGAVTSDLLTITKSATNTRTSDPVIPGSDNLVGDTLHFTLTVTNPVLYSKWENVLFTDNLDPNLQIVAGSVKVNGVADTGNNSLSSRPMGDGSTTDSAKTLTLEFDAEIVSGYGTSFKNTFDATGTAVSGPVAKSSDLGDVSTFVTVEVRKDNPTKSLNKQVTNTTATDGKNHVGDTLKYTLTVENKATNLSEWKAVTVLDDIPEGLDLSGTLATVLIDGKAVGSTEWVAGNWTAAFGTGSDARKLSVYIGDIANSEVHTITFTAKIDKSAAGKTLNNTAVAQTGVTGETDDPTITPPNPPGVVSANPVKSIEKTHALKSHVAGKTGNKYYVGDTITYTIAIENKQTDYSVWQVGDFTDDLKIGGANLFGEPVNVQIAYDSEVSIPLVKDASTNGYTYNNGLLTISVGDLITRDSTEHKKAVISFDVLILPDAGGTSILNKAAIADPGQSDVPDTTPLLVEESTAVPDIKKAVKNLTAIAEGRTTNKVGDTIEYSITVSNLATEKATWRSVLVEDVLDEAHGISGTLASVEIAENSGMPAPVASGNKYFGVGTGLTPRTLYVKAGDIANGQSKTITFTVTLLPEASGKVIPNIASAGGKNAGGQVPTGEVDPIKQLTKTHENLTAKSEGRTDYQIGDEIEYTLTVANTEVNNSTWQNVVVTDDLSLGGTGFFDYDATLGTLRVNGGTPINPPTLTGGLLTVELGNILADTTVQVTFSVKLTGLSAGQSIVNIANASPDMIAYDSFGGFTVQEEAPVPRLTKSVKNITALGDSRSSNRVGDELEYTVEVANDAVNASTWANVIITDILDPGLDLGTPGLGTLDSLKVMRGSADVTSTVKLVSDLTGNTLTVPLGDVRNSEIYTITFRAKIDSSAAGTTIKNTATADALTKETNTFAEEALPVKFMEKVHENLTIQDGSYRVGDVIRYTVTLENQAAAKSSWFVVDVRDNLTLGQDAYNWTNTLRTLIVKYGTNAPITQDASVTDTGSHDTAPTKGGKPTLVAGFLTVPLDDLIVNGGAGTESKVVLTFDVILKESTAGTTLKNKVVATPDSIDAEDGGGITVQKVAPEPLVLKSEKNLTATTAGGRYTQLGDLIEYSIVVKNNATAASTWENVTLKDVLSDAYLTAGTLASVKIDGVSASAAASWDDPLSNHQLSVNLGDIEYQKSKTVTFEVEILNPLPSPSLLPIKNTATATGNNGSGTSNETALTVNENMPDPEFSKTHTISDNSGKSDGKTHVGDTVHYTLTLKNKDTGLSTWNVGSVTDDLYLGLSGQAVFTAPYNVKIQYDSDAPIILSQGIGPNTYTYDTNGMLTVPVDDLKNIGSAPSQAVITFDVDLTDAAAGQTIKNIAVAAGATGGEDEDGDIDVEKADPVPDLQKTFSNDTALTDGRITNRVGDTLTYSITARNNATAASIWKNVVITDELAAELDISGLVGTLTAVKKPSGIGLTLQPGTGSNEGDYWFDGAGNRTLNINVGDIQDNEQVTLTFKADIDGSASGKLIKNTAEAISSTETNTPVELLSPIKVFTKDHVNKTAADEHQAEITGGNPSHVLRTNYKVGDILTYRLTLENTNPYKSVWEVETVIDDLKLGGVDVFDTTDTATSAKITYLNENGESTGGGTVTASVGATLGTDGKLSIPVDKTKSLMVGYGTGTYSKVEITFEVKIADAAAGKTLKNIAVTNDGETAEDNGGAGFTVDKAVPVKEIVKTVENLTSSDGKTRVGDKLRYTIAVSNKATANSLWTPVIVTDELSEHFDISETLNSLKVNGTTATNAGATASFGILGSDLRKLTVNLDSIANGVTKTITFDVVVLGSASGETIDNTAMVDGNPTNPTGPGTVNEEEPIKDAHKTHTVTAATPTVPGHDSGKLYVGDTVHYKIELENTNPNKSVWQIGSIIDDLDFGGAFDTPTNVTLTYSKQNGTGSDTYAPTTIGDSYAGGLLTIPVDDLRVGYGTGTYSKATITFDVVIKDAAADRLIQNVAVVQADGTRILDETDGGITVEKADVIKVITKNVENETAKAAGRTENKVGDRLHYTIIVKNDAKGSSVWSNVFVKDNLSAYLDITGTLSSLRINSQTVSPPLTAGWGSDSLTPGYVSGDTASTLIVGLGDISNGETKTIEFDTIIAPSAAGQIITNKAIADGESTPETGGPGSISDSDPVKRFTKEHAVIAGSAKETGISVGAPRTSGKVYVGDIIHYTLTLENTQPAQSVWNIGDVTDDLQLGLSGANVFDTSGTLTSAKITYFGTGPDTGIVQSASATLSGGKLSVAVDALKTIYPSSYSKAVIEFDVVVLPDAADKNLQNVARTTDGTEAADTGGGFKVEQADPIGTMDKSVRNLTAENDLDAQGNSRTTNRVGDTLQYEIAVSNIQTVPSTWENVVVTDDISTKLDTSNTKDTIKLDGVSVSAPDRLMGQLLTVNVGDIKNGETKKVLFEVVIGDAAAGTTVDNIATAKGGGEETTGGGGDTKTDEVAAVPYVSKAVTNRTAAAEGLGRIKNQVGDTLRYELTLRNDATAASTWANVVLTDPLSDALETDGTLVSVGMVDGSSGAVPTTATLTGTSTNSAGRQAGGHLTVNIGDIKNGETRVVYFDVVLGAEAAGSAVKNTASAGGESSGTETKTEEIPPIKFFEKTSENISSTDGKNRVGDTIRYTLTLENQAPEASTWMVGSITDDLSIGGHDYFDFTKTLASLKITYGSTVASTLPSATLSPGGLLTIPIDDLKVRGGTGTYSKAVVTFEVVLKPAAAGNKIENAAYTEDGADATDGPGGKTIEEVDPIPHLFKKAENLTQTNPTGGWMAGDIIRYSITVQNNATSNSTWENAQVTDVLSQWFETSFMGGSGTGTLDSLRINGLDLVAWKALHTNADASLSLASGTSAGTLLVKLGDIKNGEQVVITFEVQIKAGTSGQSIKNVAEATGDNVGPIVTPPGEVTTEELNPTPWIEKTSTKKSGSAGSEIRVGDTITYTINLENRGPSKSTWKVGEIIDALNIGTGNAQAFDFSGTLNSLKIVYGTGGPTVNGSATGATLDANGLLVIPIDDLKVGHGSGTYEKASVTFDVVVNPLAAGMVLVNTVLTSDGTEGTDGPGGKQIEKVEPVKYLNKTFTNKTAAASLPSDPPRSSNRIGDIIEYRITAANNATAASEWKDVLITDELAKSYDVSNVLNTLRINGMNFTVWQVLHPTADAILSAPSGTSAGTLSVKVGDIKNGERVAVTFDVTILPEAAGLPIYNTAKADGEQTGGGGTSVDEEKPTKLFTKSSRKIAGSAGAEIQSGDTIEYTLTLQNTQTLKSTWKGVAVSDNLKLGGIDVFNTAGTLSSLRIYYDGSTAGQKISGATISSAGVLTFPVGDLHEIGTAYNKAVVKFNVVVNPAAAGKSLLNVAVTRDNIIATDEANGFTVAGEPPVKAVQKSVQNLTAQSEGRTANKIGDELEYTVTVSNKATDFSAWKDIIVTDTLHAAFDISGTENSVEVGGRKPATGDVTLNGQVLSVKLGNIMNGESKTFTFIVKLSPAAAGQTITNTVIVDAEPGVGDGGTKIDEVPAVPYINKTVFNKTADAAGRTNNMVGDTLTYTVTMANNATNSSTWEGVVLRDPLSEALETSGTLATLKINGVDSPATLTGGLATTGYTLAGGMLNVDVGDIKNGQTRTITFDVVLGPASSGITVRNAASADGESSGTGTNTSEVSPVKSFTKTSANTTRTGSSNAQIGDTIRYTLTLENLSQEKSTWNVGEITDDLSIGGNDCFDLSGTLNSVRIAYGNELSKPASGATLTNGFLTVPVDDLKVRGGTGTYAKATITFDVVLKPAAAGKTFHNVSYAEDGTEGTDGGGITIDKVDPVPSVIKTSKNLDKVGEPDPANATWAPGDRIQYTITAQNTATADSLWTDVVVEDAIDSNFDITGTLASLTINGFGQADWAANGFDASLSGHDLSIKAGDIKNNEQVVITFEVVIASGVSGVDLSNKAKATGDNGSEESVENVVTTTELPPEPYFAKSSTLKDGTAADPVRVGDTLTYTLELENTATHKSAWVVDSVTDQLHFGGAEVFDTSGTAASVKITYTKENNSGGDKVVSGAVNTGASVDANGVLTIPVDDLKVGYGTGAYAAATITFDVVVKPAAAGKTLVNTAIAGDGTPGTDGPGGKGIVELDPIKSLTKTFTNVTAELSVPGRSTNKIGDTIRYTIIAANNQTAGSTWPNVLITDDLSSAYDVSGLVNSLRINGKPLAEWQSVHAGASVNLTDHSLSVNVGDIKNGERAAVTFEVRILDVAAGSKITNTARADGQTTTGGGGDVEEAQYNRIFTKSSEKVDGVRFATGIDAGQLDPDIYQYDTIEYTLTLQNAQTLKSTWKNVMLIDDLKLGGLDVFDTTATLSSLRVYYDESPSSQTVSATLSGGVLMIPVDDLHEIGTAHNKAVIKFRVVVRSEAVGQTLQNTAITNDGLVATDGVNGFKVKTAKADPSVVKSSVNLTAAAEGRSTNKVGDMLQYVVEVKNNATIAAPWLNVVMSDPLSKMFEIGGTLSSVRVDSNLPAPGDAYFGTGADAGTLYVSLGYILPGQSKTVTFEVVIGPSAAGQTTRNTAVAKGDDDVNAPGGGPIDVLGRHRVTYNVNGGTGQVPITGIYDEGDTATIGSDLPTRSGYTFLGWSEDPNATVASYGSGANINDIARDYVLYAVWMQNAPPPVPTPQPRPSVPTPEPSPPVVEPPESTPAAVNPPRTTPGPIVQPPEQTNPAPVEPEATVPQLNIFGMKIPLYAKEGQLAWALLNLILSLASIVIAFAALLSVFRRRKRVSNEIHRLGVSAEGFHTEKEFRRKYYRPRFISSGLAWLAVVMFFITEDTSQPVVLFNWWTLLQVVLLVVVAILTSVSRSKKIIEEAFD